MVRFRLFIAGLFITIIFVIFVITAQSSVQAQNQLSTLPPLSLQQARTQSSNQSVNIGRPAIARPAGTTSTNNLALPLIKSSDVAKYITKNGFPSGSLVSGATLKILSLDLITSKVATDRLQGEETGLPDTSLVYYVKLQGPFTTTGVKGPPQFTHSSVAKFGVEVFDAQTGNLLLWAIPNA